MARCPTCGRRLLAGTPCPTHPSQYAPARRAPSGRSPQWPDPIVGCLGEGGFATVWEVHSSSRPPYALKVAKAATELATRRMTREASALAEVGAPWVPGLIDHGIDSGGHAWLTMGLIRGDCLGDLIANELRPERLRVLLRNLLQAVSHMHEAGIIHRDLKPDNVMVSRDDRVTVLDLGMARRGVDDHDDPFATTIAGSTEYMAPEQLDSGKVTDRADVYSLGIIAFEMCALRPPFVGRAPEVERGHRAMRPPRLLDVAEDLEKLCSDALRKDPKDRPAIADLLKTLKPGPEVADAGAVRRRWTSPMAVVRERVQPVVLMWAELARLDLHVLAMLGAHKFRVISQRGRRVFAIILANDHATPASQALLVAEDLLALGAKVVLHVAECVVAGDRVSGVTLSAPETWLPTGSWTGLYLSKAFAATVDRSTVDTNQDNDEFKQLTASAAGHVLGREGDLDELLNFIDRNATVPGLVLVSGEDGVGKSTLAEALRVALAARGTRVSSAIITAPGRDRGPTSCAYVFSSVLADWEQRPIMPDLADSARGMARDNPLVMILDDVNLAEHELLDALEYMTLGGGDRCALRVVCFASETLLARRPDFGQRAQESHRVKLGGLDEASAVALAAKWLAPVDYLPVASLRPLLTVTRGNPLHIVSLCLELRERGAIKSRKDGGSFLDTASLDQLPTLALAPWMATRQLAGLPEETLALARVCAVLGDVFDFTELSALVERLDESAGGRIDIDVRIGIDELCAAGLLEEDRSRLRFSFSNGLVCEGIYATLDADERRGLHKLALAYWEFCWVEGNDDTFAVQRIARHARAIGDRAWAGLACAELARAADSAHRFVEAEQQWSAALPFLDDARLSAEALVGRARARYRQQRMADAIVDARNAAEIARAIGDNERLVDALLEEATALDWAEDFATSALRAQEARQCGSADPGRQVRIALAEARAAFRQHPADAAASLLSVANQAVEHGDRETTVIAAMLAGPVLLRESQIDRAQEIFALGEATCKQSGDLFHLAALLVNRIPLWWARGDIDRCMKDLRDAIHLAREHGQAMIERSGAYNLAEVLLWRNQLDEAHEWAQWSLSLQEQSGVSAAIPDLLLTLRVAAARNNRDTVALRLIELPEQLNPVDGCFRDALEMWLRPTTHGWRRVLSVVDRVLDYDQAIEIACLARSTGMLDADMERDFGARVRGSAIWRTDSLGVSFAAQNDISLD